MGIMNARLCDGNSRESTLNCHFATNREQLGGGVAGNGVDGFPLDESDRNNVRPLTQEGIPVHLIASVAGRDSCTSGADSILLFYEPNSKIALLTLDWG
jgi:hypothetical protein